jgi:hypothetical protein
MENGGWGGGSKRMRGRRESGSISSKMKVNIHPWKCILGLKSQISCCDVRRLCFWLCSMAVGGWKQGAPIAQLSVSVCMCVYVCSVSVSVSMSVSVSASVEADK